MVLKIIMSWQTAELLGAIHPASPALHRELLREGGFCWRIRTRESLPYFWPNQLSRAEMAEIITPRSSEH